MSSDTDFHSETVHVTDARFREDMREHLSHNSWAYFWDWHKSAPCIPLARMLGIIEEERQEKERIESEEYLAECRMMQEQEQEQEQKQEPEQGLRRKKEAPAFMGGFLDDELYSGEEPDVFKNHWDNLSSWASNQVARSLAFRKEREDRVAQAAQKAKEAKEAREAKEADDNAAIREFLRKNAEDREEAVQTFLETASKDDMETLVDELDMPEAFDAITNKAKNILHDRWRKKRLSKSAVAALQQEALAAERAALVAERAALAAERAALVAERATLAMERDVLAEKETRARANAKGRAKAKTRALRTRWEDCYLNNLEED